MCITPVHIFKPNLWWLLILLHGLPLEHSRTSELEVSIKLKCLVLAQEGTHSPVSLWMSFLGSSHRVSFRVVSCHAGSLVRSKWKLKQCKQARMRYTAGVQSLAQLFEAVGLHQLLVGGSRYFVVRAFVCLLFAQLFFLFFLFISLLPFISFVSVSTLYFHFLPFSPLPFSAFYLLLSPFSNCYAFNHLHDF